MSVSLKYKSAELDSNGRLRIVLEAIDGGGEFELIELEIIEPPTMTILPPLTGEDKPRWVANLNLEGKIGYMKRIVSEQ